MKKVYCQIKNRSETICSRTQSEDFTELNKMDCYQQDQIFPFVIRNESTLHIAKEIFQSLNKDDMGKCRLVSNDWKGFVDCRTQFWEKVPTHLYIRAAKEGRLDVCHLIIQHGQNKNPADDHNNTPLHWAANEGHLMKGSLSSNH